MHVIRFSKNRISTSSQSAGKGQIYRIALWKSRKNLRHFRRRSTKYKKRSLISQSIFGKKPSFPRNFLQHLLRTARKPPGVMVCQSASTHQYYRIILHQNQIGLTQKRTGSKTNPHFEGLYGETNAPELLPIFA